MRKKTVLIMLSLGFLLAINSLAQSSDSALIKKADTLIKYYRLATFSRNNMAYSAKQKFFNSFPNTFNEFIEIYGFEDNDSISFGLIYDSSYAHLLLFEEIYKIVPEVDYYQKLISIAIGGHYQCDAVSFYQSILRARVIEKINTTAIILSKLNDSDLFQFWYFYFDNPVPPNIPPEKLNILQKDYLRIYLIMKDALKKVKADWDD